MVKDIHTMFPPVSGELIDYAVSRDPYMGARLGRAVVSNAEMPHDPYRQAPDGVPGYCFTRPDVHVGNNQVHNGNEEVK